MTATANRAPWSGFAPLIRAGRGGITSPTLTRDYGPGAALSIRCEIDKLGDSDQAPHFSVTAEVVTNASRRRHDIEAGGCMHDEVLRYWPEARELVALHLSHAADGEPTYAEGNGWYWLAGYFQTSDRYHGGNGSPARTPEQCLHIFGEHVRVANPTELAERIRSTAGASAMPCDRCGGSGLRDGLPCVNCHGDGLRPWRDRLRDAWRLECDAMRPRWADEARAGLLWLWEHASPPDLKPGWRELVQEYLGVSLP